MGKKREDGALEEWEKGMRHVEDNKKQMNDL